MRDNELDASPHNAVTHDPMPMAAAGSAGAEGCAAVTWLEVAVAAAAEVAMSCHHKQLKR